MVYLNIKKKDENGTFKCMVVKVSNDERNRNIIHQASLVPIDEKGCVRSDPDRNFLLINKGKVNPFAIACSDMMPFCDIDDNDVIEAMSDKEMLGAFILDLQQETDEYLFVEIAVMLDKDLTTYLK